MSPLGKVVRNQKKGEFCTKNKDILEGKILAWRCLLKKRTWGPNIYPMHK